jgi:subtilisin family serine protease
MKTLAATAYFFAGLGLLSAQPLAPQARYRPDQILVKPIVAVDELAVAHTRLGSQVRKTFPRFGNLQVVTLPPGASVEAIVAEYQRSGLVEYAEPDYFVTLASVNHPNDPKYVNGSLWNLNNTTQDADIDAPEAWHFRTSAEDVVVAVIDSGVRHTHEDLTNNMWINPNEIPGNDEDDDNNGYVDDIHGINAITGSGDPNDSSGS